MPYRLICPLVLALSTAFAAEGGPSADTDPTAEARAELERLLGPAEAARVRLVRTDAAWPEDESFRITAADGQVTVTGGNRGVLWGVYELLEKYAGVEFLAPDCTHVPADAKLAVPDGTDDFQAPAFESREEYWFPVMWERGRAFGRRLRLNPDTAARWSKRLWKCHTFFKLVPPEKYGKDHPEYFSEVGGKRLVREADHAQLCLSNPEVVEIAAEAVKKAMRDEPEARYFSISQMDWKNYCECARCKAVQDEEGGAVSGPIVRFMNAIAERTCVEFPDRKLSTLSYNGTFDPPRTPLHPNASVIYAESTRDFARAFGEGPSARNHAAKRELAGWGRLTKDIHVWDYTVDFGSYPTPNPGVRTFAPNLRFYRDSNVRHAFMQGAWQGNLASLGMLKTWVLAKLMWNPDQDTDALVRRYMTAYYGAAAPQMFEYYRLAEELPAKHPELELCLFWDENIQMLDEDFRARADVLMREALLAVKDDAVRTQHVRDEAYCVLFNRLMRFVRPLNVSRECRRLSDEGKIRAWIGEIDAMCELRKPVAFSENATTRAIYLRRLKELRTGDPKVADDLSAEMAVADIKLIRPGTCCVVTNDAAARSGKAVRLPNDHTTWCVQQRISELMAWDPGEVCRLRLRVRAEIVPDADPGDPVLLCGVYDHPHKKAIAQKILKVGDFARDGSYAWVDLFEFEPDLFQSFWAAPGGDGKSGKRAFASVSLDRLWAGGRRGE